jgi:hypothetical protein
MQGLFPPKIEGKGPVIQKPSLSLGGEFYRSSLPAFSLVRCVVVPNSTPVLIPSTFIYNDLCPRYSRRRRRGQRPVHWVQRCW